LQDEGVIKVVGEKHVGSEVYSYWMYETNSTQILINKEEREREKFAAWLKRADEFEKYMSTELKDSIRWFLLSSIEK